jgi:hypothetical protein
LPGLSRINRSERRKRGEALSVPALWSISADDKSLSVFEIRCVLWNICVAGLSFTADLVVKRFAVAGSLFFAGFPLFFFAAVFLSANAGGLP